MGTISDKLNKVQATKADLKAALIEKGQAVADTDTFASYPNKIRSIKTDPVLEALEATENGTYTPAEGIDGFDSVTVNVEAEQAQPVLEELEATENNRTYYPSYGVDGFSAVSVNVEPEQVDPVLRSLDVTENGAYVPDEGVDGFNIVNVDVQPVLEDAVISYNGIYTAGGTFDGYRQVTVNVVSYTGKVMYGQPQPVTTAIDGLFKEEE